MAAPTYMPPTPNATVTVAAGEATDASSEFWRRIANAKFIVYERVPYALAQNILASPDIDTAIATQLNGYAKRVST